MNENFKDFEQFAGTYSEQDYKIATLTNKFDGACFVYNPKTIVKVAPITTENRIEYLITERRFEEAMLLVREKPY